MAVEGHTALQKKQTSGFRCSLVTLCFGWGNEDFGLDLIIKACRYFFSSFSPLLLHIDLDPNSPSCPLFLVSLLLNKDLLSHLTCKFPSSLTGLITMNRSYLILKYPFSFFFFFSHLKLF